MSQFYSKDYYEFLKTLDYLFHSFSDKIEHFATGSIIKLDYDALKWIWSGMFEKYLWS